MNNVERGVAIVGVLVVVFGAGAAWNSLSNRIDKIDDKVVAIQKTLGTTPCTAILSRQLAAIDKGRADVRKALDDLSKQYLCLEGRDEWVTGHMAAAQAPLDAVAVKQLAAELNAVDYTLAEKKRH